MQKSRKDLHNQTNATIRFSCPSQDIADLTRLYRRDQLLKKKMKAVLQANSCLEKQIKGHEQTIKEDRFSICFHLKELLKEMTSKFSHFTEERLDGEQFSKEEQAHEVIQQMIGKYEKIEHECQMLKKVKQMLSHAQENYEQHSAKLQQLILGNEHNLKQFMDSMDDVFEDINSDIKARITKNEAIEQATKEYAANIDIYEAECISLDFEEQRLTGEIAELRRVVEDKRRHVGSVKEWARIVIDKNNQKIASNLMRNKRIELQAIQARNSRLQVYHGELRVEKDLLKNNKVSETALK